MSQEFMPRLAGIEEAAAVVDPAFLNTPVVRSPSLDQALGCSLALKLETLTPIRSFKGRGAHYLLHRLGAAAAPGVVCASAGNFGQGLAHAATARGIVATVFAATGASPVKIEAMRAFGADVRLEGRDFDEAKAAARAHAAATGALFVEDGKDPAIAEGAGTIAREMAAAEALDEAVLVPLGNGSLVNGIGAWIKARRPSVRVIAVAAAGAPAMALSWRLGHAVSTDVVATIADGVAVRVPVPEALVAMRSTVDEVVEIEENAILAAMRLVFNSLGIVAEPAGALGVAALLCAPEHWAGRRVSTILCGGNLTPTQIRDWLL
jgi:threonine dehydratase